MACTKLDSTQLAIIAAIIMVAADIIALIAAIAALNEQQQNAEDTKRELEAKIKCLQDKLHA